MFFQLIFLCNATLHEVGILCRNMTINSRLFCVAETDDDLGSDEESGKDWDELEEEARRGQFRFRFVVVNFRARVP